MANNTLIASDNFASGSLAAGWTAFASGFSQITSAPRYAEPAAADGNHYGQRWTGAGTFTNGQISEITLHALTVNAGVSVTLYCYNNGTHYYNAVCNAGNGTVGIQRDFTTTIASASSLTFAANDILTFQVVGNCLSFYQNGARRCYGYDANAGGPLTAGGPGFTSASNVAVTSSQVASWRGYSPEQQDGVWTKKGPVIPSIAGDFPYGVLNPAQVMYEGNAQILSGNVFKMWYGSFTTDTVIYAESLDGIAWTRNASAVLTGHIEPAVIKVGSTYWLYAFQNFGAGPIDVYNSTDGITWGSPVASGILSGLNFYFYPFTIIAGTWYALATNGHLYTSPDGKAWTDQGQATTPTAAASAAIVQSGSTWYFWTQVLPASAVGKNSTETARYKCLDPGTFKNWVLDVHSMHISQMYEALNTPFNGQSIPGAIIETGGKTYMYSIQCPGDVDLPTIYQITLNVVPATIAELVAHPEDGTHSLATDSLTRANGTLGANWTLPTGGTALQIASNTAEPTATTTYCQAIYTGTSFGVNQYSEITLGALSDSFQAGLIIASVRMQSNALTSYDGAIFSAAGSSGVKAAIYKRVAGSLTGISPAVTITPQIGDVYRLSVTDGSDGFPTLILFMNGYQIIQTQDSSATPITTGGPGMQAYAGANVANSKISAWAGGSVGLATISGSAGVASATVYYSGPWSGSVTADGSGNYVTPNLISGAYTITPSKSGKVFSPAFASETAEGLNLTGVNFTAADLTISGGVSSGIGNAIVQRIQRGVNN